MRSVFITGKPENVRGTITAVMFSDVFGLEAETTVIMVLNVGHEHIVRQFM